MVKKMANHNRAALFVFAFLHITLGTQYVVYCQRRANLAACSIITDYLIRRLGPENVVPYSSTQRGVTE